MDKIICKFLEEKETFLVEKDGQWNKGTVAEAYAFPDKTSLHDAVNIFFELNPRHECDFQLMQINCIPNTMAVNYAPDLLKINNIRADYDY